MHSTLHALLSTQPTLATIPRTVRELHAIAYAVHGSTQPHEQALADIIREHIPLLQLQIAHTIVSQPRQYLNTALYISRQAEAQLLDILRYLQQPPHPQVLIGARSMAACDSVETQFLGYAHIERFSHIPFLLVRADAQTLRDIYIRADRTLNLTLSTPAEYRVQPQRCVFHTDTWNLDMIGAQAAWQHTTGKGATVAVIDTGIDYNHPALKERFGATKGVSYVRGATPDDDNGHGTHVAGTVAGATTGVAPACTLYAVKVLGADGSGSEVAVLKGIEWAIDHTVDVINMSLGSESNSRAEAQLIAVAAKKGISVCCAAGNDGNSEYNYPASHEGAISIAAVDKQQRVADFSNHNDAVDLAAPGVSIYSTYMGGGYDVLSGTSMATPHVAGACALLKALTKTDPEKILKHTALSGGSEHYYGSGIIQLQEACNERVHNRVSQERTPTRPYSTSELRASPLSKHHYTMHYR